MAYLAFDTSTDTLSIAIGDDQQLLGEVTVLRTFNHSIQMMPLLDQLMDDCRLTPDQLQGIIVGRGPGSYTGIRIGVTTAKVLASTLQIPLIGISSLKALIQASGSYSDMILGMFEARRNRVYAGAFWGQEGKEAVVSVAELGPWICQCFGFETIRDLPGIICTGDGSLHYKEQLLDIFGDKLHDIAPLSRQHIRAAALLELGIPLLQQGVQEDVAEFSPEYLQLAQAEAKLLQVAKEGPVTL